MAKNWLSGKRLGKQQKTFKHPGTTHALSVPFLMLKLKMPLESWRQHGRGKYPMLGSPELPYRKLLIFSISSLKLLSLLQLLSLSSLFPMESQLFAFFSLIFISSYFKSLLFCTGKMHHLLIFPLPIFILIHPYLAKLSV